ncbi:hypothetical protein ACU4GD_18355 [Cupriavidus basilensis]
MIRVPTSSGSSNSTASPWRSMPGAKRADIILHRPRHRRDRHGGARPVARRHREASWMPTIACA